MALEMKVYREIHAYEAKVMFGLSWRQLAALAIGVPLAGGLFAAIAYLLHMVGNDWKAATDTAMWAVFPVLIPVGLWGWWRPKGLKPERYWAFRCLWWVMGLSGDAGRVGWGMDASYLFTAALQLRSPWKVGSVDFRDAGDGRQELHIMIGFEAGSLPLSRDGVRRDRLPGA